MSSSFSLDDALHRLAATPGPASGYPLVTQSSPGLLTYFQRAALVNNFLVQCTFYACESSSGNVTKITLFLGYPETVNETKSRASIKLYIDEKEGSKRYAFGADKWQALMLAISLIKLEIKLPFRKKNVSFHYTREDAEQQTKAVPLNDFFPKDF